MKSRIAKLSILCALSISLFGCGSSDKKQPDSISDIITNLENDGVDLGDYTDVGTPDNGIETTDYCDALLVSDPSSWLESYCND